MLLSIYARLFNSEWNIEGYRFNSEQQKPDKMCITVYSMQYKLHNVPGPYILPILYSNAFNISDLE